MPTALSMQDMIVIFVLSPLLPFVPACSQSSNQLELHPVSGAVSFGNKPAAQATVFLHPISFKLQKDMSPRGTVADDGTFQIGTYEAGDGAPVGEFVVTIVWPEVRPEPGGGNLFSGDRLHGRYSNPENSPWKVQITEGGNVLDAFELK